MRVKRIAPCLLAAAALAAGGHAKEDTVSLASGDEKIRAPLRVGSLNRIGLAALSGSPGKIDGFLPAFDERPGTAYEAREAGPARIDIAFQRPQTLHEVRVLLDESAFRWSLAGADSLVDLENARGTFRVLAPEREAPAEGWDQVRFAAPQRVQALRLTVTPGRQGSMVVVREWSLLADQSLEALSILAPSTTVPLIRMVPLDVQGYFSGGATRLIRSKSVRWSITPSTAARVVSPNRILGRRIGPIRVAASLGEITSTPLNLEVVDAE
jgi:hypothetical protein